MLKIINFDIFILNYLTYGDNSSVSCFKIYICLFVTPCYDVHRLRLKCFVFCHKLQKRNHFIEILFPFIEMLLVLLQRSRILLEWEWNRFWVCQFCALELIHHIGLQQIDIRYMICSSMEAIYGRNIFLVSTNLFMGTRAFYLKLVIIG